MTSKFEKIIYDVLPDEPVTPNELASRLNMNYKTVQRVLLQLALTHDDVRFKNSGRIQLFWKENRPSKESLK